jgi:uncharacterized alpha/beta hydrolase family protein
MIRWIRTAQIAGGNPMPAIAWAKEIAEYVKKYEGFSSIDVFTDTFGQVGTIRWVVDYEDLASFEKVQNQIMTDPGFFEKTEKVPELFVEGKTHDTIMSSV